ncbi:hypothetical protein BY996DRAFT_6587599 [Phakopsora pachyrhizi]|nr:hypothetical protein BY996DRAFT_6587599 [Phakopsora pachyrhizi]
MALNKINDGEVLILVGKEPKKVLVLETFIKWSELSQQEESLFRNDSEEHDHSTSIPMCTRQK